MATGGRVLAAVILAAGLAACAPKAPATLDEIALDALADAVEAELNAPAQAIVDLLKANDRPTPIGLDALVIVQDQRAVPVDWWLWRRGLIQNLAPQPGGLPTFLLTEAGRAQTTNKPVWFEAQVQDPSRVDCESPAALEALGCEVELTVEPALTPDGRPFAAQTQLAEIHVLALLAPTEGGWEVRDIRTEGLALNEVALSALLGSEPARQAARQQALEQLNVTARMAAMLDPAQADPAASQTYAPPPPIEDIAPVAPVIGDSPLAPARRPLSVP